MRIMLIFAPFAVSVAAMLTSQPVHAEPATVGVSAPAGPVLFTPAEIRDLKQRRGDFADTIKSCSRQLDYRPTPMATLALDPHYTATGVNRSGNDGKEFVNDSRQAFRMGLCYLLTDDAHFAATAQRIIDAWSGTLTAVTTQQAKSTINFNAQYLIIAASWVRGANKWDSSAFDRFLVETLLPNSSSSNINNHGAWGVFLDASAAAYLGDGERLNAARTRWGTLLKGAAGPDGTLIREIERSGTSNWRGGPDKGIKGLAYTHYYMLPASLAAKIFADEGKPVWHTEEGRLFEAAFGKAAAWTQKPETFPYYASNGGKLAGVRNASYFPLLLRVYDNADAKAAVKQGHLADGGFVLMGELFGRPASRK